MLQAVKYEIKNLCNTFKFFQEIFVQLDELDELDRITHV